jgi:hypothetical protein
MNENRAIKSVAARLIAVSFILMSLSSSARLADTIHYSLKQKPRFFLTLASFNTFIDGQYAHIGGIRTGLNFNQRIRFGFGMFGLANNDVVTPIRVNDQDGLYITNGRLRMTFVSMSAEYIFHNRYPWQFTFMPVQIGYGGAKYQYISRPEQRLAVTPTETLVLYQPEISAQYNVFRWLGAGVTFGYRATVYRSRQQTIDLNAPTFAFDIRFSVDEAIKAFLREGD